MSSSTWNFPTYQCIDNLSISSVTRATGGNIFKVGPGNIFQAPTTSQPFSTSLTGVFSILCRDGWTNTNNDSDKQGIFGLGRAGATAGAFRVWFWGADTIPRITFQFRDNVGAAYRYTYWLADEDGTSYMAYDKWYQIGISANASGVSFCVNGSNTPFLFESYNVPGALNLDEGTERIWCSGGPDPATNTNLPSQIVTPDWSSLLLGPSCWTTQVLDFSSSAVRDRIWDSDGNFKNPGEDGSLWFGDTYAANTPNYYFVDGSPLIQNGSDTQAFSTTSGIALTGVTGGLRKQYE